MKPVVGSAAMPSNSWSPPSQSAQERLTDSPSTFSSPCVAWTGKSYIAMQPATDPSDASHHFAIENNLFAEKAYPQQSEQAFATYESYVGRGKKIPNRRYVGRHAEFKYWGMAETVNSAYEKSRDFPPV